MTGMQYAILLLPDTITGPFPVVFFCFHIPKLNHNAKPTSYVVRFDKKMINYAKNYTFLD